MAFDPSVIASIGDNAPDPTQAKAKAYSLADMIDTNQLRKGDIAKQKSDAADTAKVKQILQSSDLSTYEGKLRAGEQITKVSPKLGMEFQKEATQGKTAQTQDTTAQYEQLLAKNEIIGPAALALKTQHDQLIKSGKNEAEVNAAMMPQMMATLKQLEAQKLPDGTPLLAPQDRAIYEQQFSKGYNGAGLDAIIAGSQNATRQLQQKLAEQREANAERHTSIQESQETERERHDRVTENQGQQKVDASKDKLKAKGYTDKQAEFLAAAADANITLPGGRAQDQVKATIDGELRKHPELSPAEIVDGIRSGKLKLTAETSAARTAGTQIGRVSVAVNEIKPFGDQVLEASKNIPRGSTNLTMNGLMQMAETQGMDPNLLVLKAKLQSLNNAYDQLAARGGTDAEKREHIHSLFDARLDDKNIQALVKAINEEGAGAKQAAESTIGEVSGSTLPGAQAGPAQPAARPGQAASSASAGTVVHWDDLH